MDWQVIAVAAMIGVATLYLIVAAWRTLTGKPGRCGGGCACPSQVPPPSANGSPLVPVDRLRLRRRDDPA